MNFAFDYDGCANADVPTFRTMIQTLKEAGHKVYIVTMRYPSECRQVVYDFSDIVEGIVPTSRLSKRSVCGKLGLYIHIWMDDFPRTIEESAGQIWPNVTPEGTVHAIDHVNGLPAERQVVPLTDFTNLMVTWPSR